jgi:hypothetical protein
MGPVFPFFHAEFSVLPQSCNFHREIDDKTNGLFFFSYGFSQLFDVSTPAFFPFFDRHDSPCRGHPRRPAKMEKPFGGAGQSLPENGYTYMG